MANLSDLTPYLVKSKDQTLTGKLTTKTSATGGSGLVVPHGAAPTSPNNGDVWSTTAGLYVRVNGTTVGPLAQAGFTQVGSTISPSGSSAATFTSIPAIYNSLYLVMNEISDTADAALFIDYEANGSGSWTALYSTLITLSAAGAYDGVVEVNRYAATSGLVFSRASFGDTGTGTVGANAQQRVITAPNVITGLRARVASGNFDGSSAVELWAAS